ncbi:MAG: 6-phospho-3-hexuloisomerase [Phycisphaerae bacterium]|nr:6-phospho-3-hexuloisomerase [Phycisphaerae bacterium]
MDIHNIGRRICDEVSGVLAAVDEASVDQLTDRVVAARRLFLAGAGRSGWVARCLAMRLMHLGRDVHVVGDSTTPGIESGDLLLVCSGSGETPALLGFIRAACEAGAGIALITACPDSTAAGLADVTVHLPAPTPKARVGSASESIQPMGSLFEQSLLLFGDAVVLLLSAALEQDHEQMWRRHTNLE